MMDGVSQILSSSIVSVGDCPNQKPKEAMVPIRERWMDGKMMILIDDGMITRLVAAIR